MFMFDYYVGFWIVWEILQEFVWDCWDLELELGRGLGLGGNER